MTCLKLVHHAIPVMASVTEERKAVYFAAAKAHHEQRGADAEPLEPISETAEDTGDGNNGPTGTTAPFRHAVASDKHSRQHHGLAGVRGLSHVAPVASWNLLRLSMSTFAKSYLSPKTDAYSPEAVRSMPWRARLDFYLSQPEDSSIGRALQNTVMFVLMVNIAVMAGETLDGPRYGSSAPAYSYLPGERAFTLADAGFTAFYVVEFAVRAFAARSRSQFWKSWTTWVSVFAFLPFFIHAGADALNKGNADYNPATTDSEVAFVRLFRIVRVMLLARIYLGTKILMRVSAKVVAPLKITVSVGNTHGLLVMY